MWDEFDRRVALPEGIVSDLIEAWQPVFAGFPGLSAAWLFGSTVHGGPSADLDVGLLLKDKPFLSLAEKAGLAGRLEDRSPVRLPIDLRVLTDDEPVFSFAVLRDGVRLFERHRESRVMFEATVFSRYQDMAPLLVIARHGLLRSLRHEQG